MAFPLPGFPGAGVGSVNGIADATGLGFGVEATADNSLWVGGYVLTTILAELRVQTQLLAVIANVTDSLAQLRSDAVADMGTLYAANPSTPIASS